MATWRIGPEPVDGDGVDVAMREYFAEMGRRVLGRAVTEEEVDEVLSEDPGRNLCPPRGQFLVARDAGSGVLLGCAGVRLIGDGDGDGNPRTAELKRMYVRPAGRGAGLGRGLLRAAEEAAADLGAARMVCETNTQLTDARALYTRHGYTETAPYEGHGKADHWYAKPLARRASG